MSNTIEGILVLVVIIGIPLAILVGIAVLLTMLDNKKEKKLLAQGLIRDRGAKFHTNAVIFYTDPSNLNALYTAITKSCKAIGQGIGIGGDYNKVMKYNHSKFKASLQRCPDENGRAVFFFCFDSTKLSSGNLPEKPILMNQLITAIEKEFTQYSPDTEIRIQPMEMRKKYSLF